MVPTRTGGRLRASGVKRDDTAPGRRAWIYRERRPPSGRNPALDASTERPLANQYNPWASVAGRLTKEAVGPASNHRPVGCDPHKRGVWSSASARRTSGAQLSESTVAHPAARDGDPGGRLVRCGAEARRHFTGRRRADHLPHRRWAADEDDARRRDPDAVPAGS